jgi:hypothetical protein
MLTRRYDRRCHQLDAAGAPTKERFLAPRFRADALSHFAVPGTQPCRDPSEIGEDNNRSKLQRIDSHHACSGVLSEIREKPLLCSKSAREEPMVRIQLFSSRESTSH